MAARAERGKLLQDSAEQAADAVRGVRRDRADVPGPREAAENGREAGGQRGNGQEAERGPGGARRAVPHSRAREPALGLRLLQAARERLQRPLRAAHEVLLRYPELGRLSVAEAHPPTAEIRQAAGVPDEIRNLKHVLQPE